MPSRQPEPSKLARHREVDPEGQLKFSEREIWTGEIATITVPEPAASSARGRRPVLVVAAAILVVAVLVLGALALGGQF